MITQNEIAALKAQGILAQQQKGYFSIRVLSRAGNFTSAEFQTLAEIAAKHGLEAASLQAFVGGIMQRMIFDGALKNTTLRHSSVLGFQLFQDGIVVDKASGRSPHLMIEGDTETLAVILGAALAMSGGS